MGILHIFSLTATLYFKGIKSETLLVDLTISANLATYLSLTSQPFTVDVTKMDRDLTSKLEDEYQKLIKNTTLEKLLDNIALRLVQ